MDTLHTTKKIAQIRALQCHFCARSGLKKPAHCKMCHKMDQEIDNLMNHAAAANAKHKMIVKSIEELIDDYDHGLASGPISETIRGQREQKGFNLV